jgi:hypothetical protein
MTLNDNELYSSASQNAYPRIQSEQQHPHKFGPVASAPELEVGTPVAFDHDNDRYLVWSSGGTVTGASTIVGFIFPLPVQLHATEEVLGVVMERGEIHYDDIVLPDGEDEDALKAEIRDNCMKRGLRVVGLTQVH